MKICFLADAAHPNTQNWVEYFANELNHEIHIISFNRPGKKIEGIKLHHLDFGLKKSYNVTHYHPINFLSYGFIKSKFRYILGIPEIKTFLKEINPDILIGYRIVSYGFSAAAANFHPLVIVGQSQQLYEPENSSILRSFAKYAIKRADLIQAWGGNITKKIIKLGADPNIIEAFPKGIDLNKFKPADGENSSGYTLISTRSLFPQYRIDSIVKAIGHVKIKIPNVKYLVAGEGDHKKYLIKLTERLGLSNNIDFLGRVDYELLPGLLQTANAYISTTKSDGVSSSLLEAMACGLFPVVTNNEANRYWVENGINGFLVPYDKPEVIAERIVDFFKGDGFDKSYKTRNLDIVKEKADRHKNMARMEKMYSNLIEEYQK